MIVFLIVMILYKVLMLKLFKDFGLSIVRVSLFDIIFIPEDLHDVRLIIFYVNKLKIL